ncbi:MAG: hypothetical protein ABI164_03780 [Acidobacteriaceae bacterium]
MDFNRLVAEIDSEISRLQQARALLTGESVKRGPGRPKAAATTRKTASTATKKVGRKRRLSPEGRKRIAEAMKKRWAERKKQQGAK